MKIRLSDQTDMLSTYLLAQCTLWSQCGYRFLIVNGLSPFSAKFRWDLDCVLTAGVAEEHGALLVAVAVSAGGELVGGRLDQEAEQRVGGRHGVAVTQRGHLPAAARRFVGASEDRNILAFFNCNIVVHRASTHSIQRMLNTPCTPHLSCNCDCLQRTFLRPVYKEYLLTECFFQQQMQF